MPRIQGKRMLLPLFAALALTLAACGGAQPVVVETVGPAPTSAGAAPTTAPAATTEGTAATTAEATEPAAQGETEAEPTPPPGSLDTPHPILGDVRTRQALAFCSDRSEIIRARYPYLDDQQRQSLLIDSFLPKSHWAYAQEGLTLYSFDPAKGNALLEEAGWKVPDGQILGQGAIRVNAEGKQLSLKYMGGDTQTAKTVAAVLEQQWLNNCGVQIVRNHVPGAFMFGTTTGLQVRDFELAAFAWVGEPDPKGATLYSCNQIPLPENNWEGQNFMGWCNDRASKAIIAANNTLDRQERIRQYGIFQEEFTKDMISLPLFQTFQIEAANNNVVGFNSDPTEYITANAEEWGRSDGVDNLVFVMNGEPETLYSVVGADASQSMILQLISVQSSTKFNYDYQAVALTQLPTIENGGATNADVEVKEGDLVWTTDQEAKPLAPGVEVVNAAGETVTYESGTVTMKQLAVTFQYVDGIKWEDGEPLKKADFELAVKINCDPDSGAVSLTLCESIKQVDYQNDTTYTINYLPGVQWPEYFIYNFGALPSHQVLADGRKLADVPAKDWATIPEVAEKPLSTGPYRIVEWEKGQRVVLEANPYYYKGEPKIKRLTVRFIEDPTQAVAQLLTGDVDILEAGAIGGEAETVLNAAREGKVQAIYGPNPTWAHVDINLFTR